MGRLARASPPGGLSGARAARADYWIVLDTNVLVDYARHADGQAPDMPLPGGFIRFIEDNRALVLRLDTGKREMRTFMQHHAANNSVRVQRLVGRFSVAKRRHLRGYREYLCAIVERLESAASDPLSDDARRWLASKRTALASSGFAGAEREEADPAQRRAALRWLLDSATRNDTWIMAKAAKLSEAKPVRLVSNDGDMIAFRGLLKGLTGGRLLVARPREWD